MISFVDYFFFSLVVVVYIFFCFIINFLRVIEEVSNETEKNVAEEKPAGEEDAAAEGNKETPAIEAEEKEPEDKVNDRLN
jgi:Na+-transporting methylmalonyl-CoA/oxaloacetate decarboxylase gamma subunit